MADLYVNSISFDLGSGQINNPTQESGELWYDTLTRHFRYAPDENPDNIEKIINETDLIIASGDIINQIDNSGVTLSDLMQVSGDIVLQLINASGEIIAQLNQISGELQTQIDTKIDADQHRDLDQLVHNIAETSFEELTYSGSKVDSVILWADSGKTTKVRENIFTYTGSKVDTEVIKQYDGSGILTETLSGEFTYTGGKLENIDWTLL